MMKWYRYIPDSDIFDAVKLEIDDDEPVVGLHYQCKSVLDTWVPIRITGFADNPGVAGDFPSLNNYSKMPVFSQRAWDVLRPLIGYCSEALPVQHPSGVPFHIINVMEIIDCLDEERSELVRNATTGRVSRVFKYCFKSEMIDGKQILKLPLKSGSDLIVSDEFRRSVEEKGLRGLLFDPISEVQ